MPYDGRFIHAKNCNRKLFRDEKTGNRIEYCSHDFVVYPQFGTSYDSHAKFIPLESKTFEGLRGTCRWCGDIIHIWAENVVKDSTAQDKILEKSLKETKEDE